MEGEYDKLQEAALSCKNTFIWPAVRFALETAVRRSELLSMSWVNTDLDRRIVMLPDTKNGTKREVPLTTAALDIIQKLPKRCDRVFETTDYSIRHGWDRLVKRAGIKDLRFHDLRHEAVSRLFEAGLSIPEVALISGHKDYRMLARYTHLKADNLVMHPHFS
jgi:integrase